MPPVTIRLHRGGRWRSWLGRRLGGDAALGDRAWRRCLHFAGASVLLYYLLPPGAFLVVPTTTVLLAALAAVLVLEALRLAAGLELPTIRPYERRRLASYAYYAVGLTLAVLLFPRPIAVAVVLGTALVDPLIGELRLSGRWRPLYPALPVAVWAGLGFAAFLLVGAWTIPAAAIAALAGAGLAVAAERPRMAGIDDDLVMTLVPALALTGLLLVVPGFPGLAG